MLDPKFMKKIKNFKKFVSIIKHVDSGIINILIWEMMLDKKYLK